MSASKVLGIFCLTLILLLTATGIGFAQNPQPPQPTDVPIEPPYPPGKYPTGEDQFGWGNQPHLQVEASNEVSAQALTLGAVGLSFSYAQTFGTTEIPYISDTAHLNHPWGIATDGANVLIGEQLGRRVIKYTNAGAHVSTIGTAGTSYYDGEPWEIFDMAVDASGQTWVVDNSSRVIIFDASNKYVDDFQSDGTFSRPAGIAFDSAGNVYISDGGAFWNNDIGNQRILVYNSAGTLLSTIGTTGVKGTDNAHFFGPQHIAIYGSMLYVADSGNHRIQIFNISIPTAPVYSATIGTTGESGWDAAHFDNPAGVAVDSNYIYVADRYNNRVQVFNRIARSYLSTIGEWGTGNYQFKDPTDVAVDSAGNIYVADFENTRVQQFTSSWVYQRTYGTTGVPYLTDDGYYNTPSDVAIASDGSMYITEDNGQRLIKLNANGTTAWTIGAAGIKFPDWPTPNDRLQNPADIAINAAGKIYVADQWNGRVQVYNPNGTYSSTLGGGTGNYDFTCPLGLAIAQNGYIYVTDPWRNRVQIFNAAHAYVGTLGVTDVSGSDNAHFNNPQGVAVDSNGFIYVADSDNYRVQVFNSSRVYVRTLGVTGVSGSDFAHFEHPERLAVDSSNRLYVSDAWSNSVQVFDSSGAYLTTIGDSWGNQSGKLRSPQGLAVDQSGALYVADSQNHRIQKFTIGTPNWAQTNINGFGKRNNRISSLASFGGQVYAGTFNYYENGAQLWRSSDGKNWSAVMTNGFGDVSNIGIDHLIEFNGKFYAGTWNSTDTGSNGGQIWRSGDGTTWERVVTTGFGDATNVEIIRMAVFDNQIYASTWTDESTHGTEIWRSSTGNEGDWTRVVVNGFGDTTNISVITMETFNGYLYAGVYNWDNTAKTSTGSKIWRTADGVTWMPIITDGFGNLNSSDMSLVTFGDSLYYAGVGTWLDAHTPVGGQVWKCTAASGCDSASDWTSVTTNGFGNSKNTLITPLRVFGNRLYAVTFNSMTGMEVWQTGDGASWQQVGFAGFGDSNNSAPYCDNSIVVFNNSLFIGTQNGANGGEIWSMDLPAPVSITRAGTNPTSADSVRFTVTFSKPVENVGQNDFSLDNSTGLITGATIGGVSGSGTTYTVTVNTGAGNGTLRLDMPLTATVNDLAGNSLVGLPFEGGQIYDVDKTPVTRFDPVSQWSTGFGLANGWTVQDYVRTVGDVTGDGKADLVGFGADGVYVAVATGTGFGPVSQWSTGFGLANGWTVQGFVRTVGDVTGDGKADLVGFGADGVYVAVATGIGFGAVSQWSSGFGLANGWTVQGFVRTVGDVNNDGKADLVGFGADGVYVAVATGTGFGAVTQWSTGFGLANGWTVQSFVRTVGDINKDGNTDLIGFGADGVYVATSTGTGFSAVTQWSTGFGLANGWTVQNFVRTVGDVSGDGNTDLVGFGLDGVYVAIAQ